MDIKKLVLVNGHGGNVPLLKYINEIENELDITIVFNNKIVELEGPHAGTGELSMGSVLKMVDKLKLPEHCNFQKYPEVGMVGFKKARNIDEEINIGAKSVENEGVYIDEDWGNELIETAIKSIIDDVTNLLD